MKGEKILVEDQIAKNKRMTVVICGFMFLLLFGVIFAVAFLWGLPLPIASGIGIFISVVYIWVTYSFSVKSVLSATGAKPVNLHNRNEKILDYKVEELAIAAGLPKPKVYVQHSHDINAFATGKKYGDSIVCVTTGALEKLTHEELEGVVAHELSHIKNRDILLATVIIGVVGTIAIISEILLRSFIWGGGRRNRNSGSGWIIIVAIIFAVLAPVFARLTYLAISRKREYLADSSGANLTKNPGGLASALKKIRETVPTKPKMSKTVAPLYIANPFLRVRKSSIFATHPPIDERINRLKRM